MSEQQIVIASPEQAQQWRVAIGAELKQVYEAAQERGDETTLQLVNSAWVKAQELAQLAESSMAAGVVVAEQRDAIAKEYNDLLQAIDSLDEDHPRLKFAMESIWEGALDDATWVAEEAAESDLFNELYEQLMDALDAIDPRFEDEFRSVSISTVLHEMIATLRGGIMNGEQQQAFLDLARTFWTGRAS